MTAARGNPRRYLFWEQTPRKTVSFPAMHHVQSNVFEAIAYDEQAHLLRARFRDSGKTVVYEEVPPEIYDALIFSDSIGRYFHDHVETHYRRRN